VTRSVRFLKRLLDNKRQNKTTLLLSDKFLFLKENNLQEPEFSPAALCSIPFSNAVGEKYNFPQSPQWFL
jgi:hypothetical protein